MKFAVAALAFAAGAFAQEDVPTSLPKCANACVTKFTSGDLIAGCKQGQIKCVCENKDFLDNIACCLADACDEAEQRGAVLFAGSLCEGANVQVPDVLVCKDKAGGGGSGSNSTDSGSDDSSSSDGKDGGDSSGDSSDDSTSTEGGDGGSAAVVFGPSAAVLTVVGLVGGLAALL